MDDTSSTWVPPTGLWVLEELPTVVDPYYEDPYNPDPYAKM